MRLSFYSLLAISIMTIEQSNALLQPLQTKPDSTKTNYSLTQIEANNPFTGLYNKITGKNSAAAVTTAPVVQPAVVVTDGCTQEPLEKRTGPLFEIDVSGKLYDSKIGAAMASIDREGNGRLDKSDIVNVLERMDVMPSVGYVNNLWHLFKDHDQEFITFENFKLMIQKINPTISHMIKNARSK